MAVCFLHTGDLHLGSALAGMPATQARLWRANALEAVRALLYGAKEQGAALLLFAGDVFDTPTPDPALARDFFAILAEVGLPAVIAPGNHDYVGSGGVYEREQLPQNVTVFQREELVALPYPALGVTVYGYGFRGEAHAAPILPAKEELARDGINILLAHAVLGAPASPYAPLTGASLAGSGFDYAALGHVHLPPAPRRFGNTVAAYCGFFAGRGFDEIGYGTANLVTIDGARTTVLPLQSTAYPFRILEVDCTGAITGEDIRRTVKAALETANFERNTALRVTLTGEVGADCTPSLHALRRLGEAFALFEVKDGTLPLLDRDRLLHEPSLRGAFYRAMLPRLESEDAATRTLAGEALRMGLAALAGREVL